MQRRRFLTFASAAAAGCALSACGFALRGRQDFPFQSLFIQAQQQSQLARQLQRMLEASGVTVLRAPDHGPQEAQAVFELLQESQERAVISQSATGSVRELQLRLRVRYRLHRGDAQAAEEVELLQTRDLNYDESSALAKEMEEQILFRDMQLDLVGQIVRRLSLAQ
ncbi:hypothetical protein AAV94_00655 [Lampropedia cohaerens]|uniref:LPS-assembly lipoprotein LptE n=1 Tax=Lampropedia cohaerens TaxID=1610491 RepID=A0A0U1Q3R2_9BURK|nr:LPS assembly lipoprotein LptE [Lampropedia cohaerens]KKW69275.1 hypothetical protein AAV94_00655 [Lampropedia cohaerens]